MITLSLLFAAAISLPAAATFETVLIPVSPGAVVNGANGSVWRSELTVLNSGIYPVTLTPLVTLCPPFECPANLIIEPGTSSIVYFEEGINNPPEARFVYAVPDARHLQFNLRAFSERETSPGAAVPVVRTEDTLTSTVHLIGIPGGAGLRSTVRVYDVAPEPGLSTIALVRVFDTSFGTDQLIATLPLQLSAHQEAFAPGYGALHDLQQLISAHPIRFRVEVDPPPGKAIWAFVSTVESATDAVLVTTPGKR